MINLKIDPEFQSQIPPLTDDELRWQGASYSGAHPVFVFMETHAVPYATSGSFLRTPSAVVSYKTCPANLARTS